jgi:lauroyl/myristoyl acyltransferase
MQHPGILFMRLIAPLPLGMLRRLGTVLGWLPYVLARHWRHVVQTDLAPDMNLRRKASIFVPFYGVPTATVPSLPRFAQLGRAQVVPITARITSHGYDVEVHPVW